MTHIPDRLRILLIPYIEHTQTPTYYNLQTQCPELAKIFFGNYKQNKIVYTYMRERLYSVQLCLDRNGYGIQIDGNTMQFACKNKDIVLVLKFQNKQVEVGKNHDVFDMQTQKQKQMNNNSNNNGIINLNNQGQPIKTVKLGINASKYLIQGMQLCNNYDHNRLTDQTVSKKFGCQFIDVIDENIKKYNNNYVNTDSYDGIGNVNSNPQISQISKDKLEFVDKVGRQLSMDVNNTKARTQPRKKPHRYYRSMLPISRYKNKSHSKTHTQQSSHTEQQNTYLIYNDEQISQLIRKANIKCSIGFVYVEMDRTHRENLKRDNGCDDDYKSQISSKIDKYYENHTIYTYNKIPYEFEYMISMHANKQDGVRTQKNNAQRSQSVKNTDSIGNVLMNKIIDDLIGEYSRSSERTKNTEYSGKINNSCRPVLGLQRFLHIKYIKTDMHKNDNKLTIPNINKNKNSIKNTNKDTIITQTDTNIGGMLNLFSYCFTKKANYPSQPERKNITHKIINKEKEHIQYKNRQY